jgi:hypothetical protein
MPAEVLRLADITFAHAQALLARFALELVLVPDAQPIPGSFWGDDEAGLIAGQIFARNDTPLHSLLHEACHWITCSPARRAHLHTDAADNQMEENATCFLQIVLAALLPGFGSVRALEDMDAWGYSFRLGSAGAWFWQDAQDERAWLQSFGLIQLCGVDKITPTFRVRGE